MPHARRTLKHRYGRHSHHGAGARPVDEMLAEEVHVRNAQTVRAPRMTMKEQVEYDRAERARRAAEERIR
jgi:hypothetical protein